MAKNKVYITLEVGDKGSKVVKSFDKNTEQAFNKMKANAKAATTSMGSSLQKLKKHWMAITAAMAGAIVLVKKMITVSMAQEQAEVALAAALKVTGEYSKDLAAHFADFASGIQKVTTYGDEEVLQLMALQKNLGVATNKLEDATKMSIGLATATGRDVQSMAMYIALAQQGEFTMLRRYIPALRSTTDATEQMKIVTYFAARGYKVAQEQAKTFGGSLKQLTNLFSDLLERYANVIVKNEAILDLFKQGRARLIELIEQFERWLKVNQNLIRQKTYESIDKIKSALSKIWTVISYDPAILEYGIVGLAIGGRKGAVIFGALGHMKTWVENLSAAFGLASAGVISFREIATANFKELEALVKKYESSLQGLGVIRIKIEKPEKPELPLLKDATPKITAPEFADNYWLNIKKSSEQALNEETKRMNKLIAFEQKTNDMLLEMKAQYYLDDKELAEQTLRDEIEIMNKIANEGKSTFDDLKNAVTGWASTFSSQLTDMLWAADTTFKDILKSFMQMITQMVIQKQVIEPMLGAIFPKAPVAIAHGNVFQNGSITPYARGGIVSRPTVFPMASGMGLMGEKGAEAVMPLARTPQGDLGVKTEGGTPNIEINMINQSGQALEATQQGGRQESGKFIIDVIVKELQRGKTLRQTIRSTI